MSEYPENELEQAAWGKASALSAGERLNNLTEAMVEDILKAPAEEILLEELSSRFEKLRAKVSRLSAALATAERAVIAPRDSEVADMVEWLERSCHDAFGEPLPKAAKSGITPKYSCAPPLA